MTEPLLPLIVDSRALEACLDRPDVAVIDVGAPSRHQAVRVPGARHLDYAALVTDDGPVQGLLPPPQRLGESLGAAGITPATHVVAYDDEDGARACRLLWTLDALGHRGMSLLNGGLSAWQSEGRHLDQGPAPRPAAVSYPAQLVTDRIADRAYILGRLGTGDTLLLDARSPAEYRGDDVRARRGGHIPGAVNVEWREAVDRRREYRLRPAAELRALYLDAGVTPEREVITYCHSHRRSAHTYIVLKALGYPRLRGYPGSWSDWGNAADTPVE